MSTVDTVATPSPSPRDSFTEVISSRLHLPGRMHQVLAYLLIFVGAVVSGVSMARGPAASVVVAGGVVVVLAMLLSRTVLACVLVALVPAISGLARGGPVPVLKVSEALILLGAGLALCMRSRLERSSWTILDYAFAAYAAAALAFGGYHMLTSSSSLLDQLRVAFQPLLLFLLYRAIVVTVTTRKLLWKAIEYLLILSAFVAVISMLQAVGAPGVRDALVALVGSSNVPAGDISGTVRATGPFPVAHSVAGYLMPAILLALALLLDSRTPNVLSRRLLVTVLLLDILGMVTSLTIGASLATIAGALLIGFMYRRTRHVLMGLLGAALIAGLLFGPAIAGRYNAQYAGTAASSDGSLAPQTIAYRMQIWERDFIPVLEPVLLQGYGNEFPDTVQFTHTENQYVTFLLRGGLPLLIFGVGLIATAIAATLNRRNRSAPTTAPTARVLLAISVAVLPLNLIWPYLTNAGFSQMWCVTAGLMVAGIGIHKSPSEINHLKG